MACVVLIVAGLADPLPQFQEYVLVVEFVRLTRQQELPGHFALTRVVRGEIELQDMLV